MVVRFQQNTANAKVLHPVKRKDIQRDMLIEFMDSDVIENYNRLVLKGYCSFSWIFLLM